MTETIAPLRRRKRSTVQKACGVCGEKFLGALEGKGATRKLCEDCLDAEMNAL